jgi:glycosyltransferase involved in cell wall biosynthesis
MESFIEKESLGPENVGSTVRRHPYLSGRVMMRLLHVIAGIDPQSGGTTTALRNILAMESVVGIEHEVLTMTWGEPDPEIVKNVPVFIARPSFPHRYARSLEAIRWLQENAGRFDLIVIHGVWSWLPWRVSRVLREMKKPYAIYPHGQLDPFDVKKKWMAKKILGPIFVRTMLESATAILCTSPMEARLIERYGASPRVEALPLPVPGSSKRGDGNRFRSKWKVKEGEFIFLFLSRINYKKGLDILIPVFARLVHDSRDVKLVIAGSDNEGYGEKVRHWVDEQKIRSNVIFPGFLQGEEKEDALAAADCFVLPSMNENFALAVVESLDAGVPVIISENVYINEEISKANAGWVCRFSFESLYSVMMNVIDNTADYRAKKQMARSTAKIYSPERIGPMYLRSYESFIHPRS